MSVPTGRGAGAVAALPPSSFFLTSAVFHYLGPSLAVLLFAHVGVLGVAWLRIASAAVVFALWRRPWRVLRRASPDRRRVLLALGAVLAAMNSLFYLAVDRLPLAQVPTGRDLVGVALVIAGVAAHQTAAEPALTRDRAPDAAGTAPPAGRPRPGPA